MIRWFTYPFSLGFVLAVLTFPSDAVEPFVFGFEDLPLMEGLTQVAQGSVLFDTPQGRIVQASAIGAVTQDAVLTFYTLTLPQLGWTEVAEATFRREGEILRLEFSDADHQLMVQFFAEPSGDTSR
jgi:hypothetical protein